eukprot:COSAG02_NODE_301_length_25237_cov_19.918490_21_plen_74_part_00
MFRLCALLTCESTWLGSRDLEKKSRASVGFTTPSLSTTAHELHGTDTISFHIEQTGRICSMHECEKLTSISHF